MSAIEDGLQRKQLGVTTINQASIVAMLDGRCAELKTTHQQRIQRRALVTAQIDELGREKVALDIEIAGIEGHGAEAELLLNLVRNAQPPSQQLEASANSPQSEGMGGGQ